MANVRRYLLAEELPDGGRRISHPSGLVVIETRQQRRAHRAELAHAIHEAEAQLSGFDTRNPRVRNAAPEGRING